MVFIFSIKIKALRKSYKLSQSNLAKELKVTQQAIGKWETGKSVPDTQMLKKLSEYFKTSVDYLLGTETTMEEKYPFEVEYNELNAGVGVPIIGTVKAGYNAMAYSDDYGYEYANVKNPEDYFYLIVRGDSMEPRIKDGDLALVHKQAVLNDGDLGVIVYGDNEGTLKKFTRKDNMIILQPFNPNYEAKIISGEELNEVYIAGKVVETKTKW